MSEAIEVVKEWVKSIGDDVAAIKRVVDTDKCPDDARKLAAGALNYLVSRMDLVPDWTDTIGCIDDVMVLRVCMGLASSHGLDELDGSHLVVIGRLSNDADRIEQILGHDLESKLRKYCQRLATEEVRGRKPETIIKDPAIRKQLYSEVDDEVRRMPAANFTDAESVQLKLRSYLHAKLKTV
ncbi:MAG TPA: YkvA family protein [Kofleriaceae bacterium]|nr:YkvA family protein [Kofleriaceae bacterium]